MDEEETKNCPNCKRDIPAVNFTTHAVHCARNIRVCPACKEPVPGADLDAHHQKYHKLLPCKQCGESVCGSDLEDHIRDSCANTIKSCRFCELELPRRELPAHESYCGVRTEQCADCQEWVMIKYRQLHLDSNHGFIRLSDDPAPNKDPSKLIIRPAAAARPNVQPAAPTRPTGFGPTPLFPSGFGPTSRNNVPSTQAQNLVNGDSQPKPGSSKSANRPPPAAGARSPSPMYSYSNNTSGGSSTAASNVCPQDGARAAANGGARKRTNDQPQINTNKEVANKVDKHLPTSHGPKKRPAPKPPSVPSANHSAHSSRNPPSSRHPAPPATDPRRDMAYYSALQRQQREERERNEQNEYNFAHGLPPVLNPAAKLEKLRKMDALQNRDTEEEYRNRMKRRSPDIRDEEERRRQEFKLKQGVTLGHGPVAGNSRAQVKTPTLTDAHNPHTDERVRNALRERDGEDRRQEFKNLKPMSPEQFMARFNELQLRADEAAGAGAGGDRFSEIKSSLRELRRGLNEVTAPYNVNNNASVNNNFSERVREEERLPCEFCSALVPPDDLVQHQTGCRPDLAQYWGPRPPAAPSPPPAARAPHAPHASHASHAPRAHEDPVIPCEFCAESLPVYLIAEHQERCAREGDMLSAD